MCWLTPDGADIARKTFGYFLMVKRPAQECSRHWPT
jgi:hypothetical protein